MTGDDELGYVDFVIKVYFKNVHPNFPDGGKMSQHLHGDSIADLLAVASVSSSVLSRLQR